jgi:steroid delta-isomerase-like uncharacterized protein
MASRNLIDAYFSAFNKHDPDTVAALFGKSGAYVDPAVSAGVKGQGIKDYLRAHFAAFPDARYRITRSVASREGLMAVEWRFRGTNTGPIGESTATNRSVDLGGASILQARAGKIRWLHGYYDRRSLLKQLGL